MLWIKDEDTISEEIKALSDNIEKPNLVALSYALRHPETWPRDFVWDYGNCNTCAVGLARKLWVKSFSDFPRISEQKDQNKHETYMSRVMAMSYRETQRIFFKLKDYRGGFGSVTPDDVADAIDAYLKAN